jgi:hypothetical protein
LSYPTPVERSSFCLVETGYKRQEMDGCDSGSDVADVARVVACAIWGWPAGLWIDAHEVALGMDDGKYTGVLFQGWVPLRAEIGRAWGRCRLSAF